MRAGGGSMRKVGMVLLVLVGVPFFIAAPAVADKPARGCPPDFRLADLQDVLEIGEEFFPDVPEEHVIAGFQTIDKNDDGLICSQRKQEGKFNFIDNTSNAQGGG
jgi:hypothetical protein